MTNVMDLWAQAEAALFRYMQSHALPETIGLQVSGTLHTGVGYVAQMVDFGDFAEELDETWPGGFGPTPAGALRDFIAKVGDHA